MKPSVQYIFFVCLLSGVVWWNLDTLDLKPDFSPRAFWQSPLDFKPSHSPTSGVSIAYFDVPNFQPSAHASAIVDISRVSADSNMLLYFAGSREGGRDVKIYQSFFTHTSDNKGVWSEPTAILDATSLSRMSGKFIKKLGNPVSFVDAKGRVHLFVVGVSMGGWATSRIYWLVFDSDLRSLRFNVELHLSPFFNLSFLVRTPAILYEDGGFVLPIYHELIRKYPLLLEFSPSLELLSATKSVDLLNQLQPSFVPISSHLAVGIYRNYKQYQDIMYVNQCTGANQCTIARPSNLKNYDSSSVLFKVFDSIFVLHNQPQSMHGNKREELWLYKLQQKSLEKEEVIFKPFLRLDEYIGDEVSYPSVSVGKEFVHIAYTYGRKHIRSVLIPISYFATQNLEGGRE